jgi:hypothetical protein
MSTTAIAAEALSQPIAVQRIQLEKSDPPAARPSTTLDPTRPEEERPDTEGDRRVGDIDDLPRPDWNDTPENARSSLAGALDQPR